SVMARVSGKVDSFQTMLGEGATQALRAERQIEMPPGDGQLEARPPFEERREIGDEATVESVYLDLASPVDALAGRLAQDRRRIAVRVDHDTLGALAGAMEAVGVRQADLDPGLDPAAGRGDPEGRLVSVGDASLREGDPLLVLQAPGEQARGEVLQRLRWMEGRAHRERLVDAAVHVGERDVEVVDRRGQRHAWLQDRRWSLSASSPLA